MLPSVFLVSLLATAPVGLKSLYCTGESTINGAVSPDEAILVLDPGTKGFVLETAAFRAEGPGSVSQAEYRGRLIAADGSVHEFVLNRYTSEFVSNLIIGEAPTVEFRGNCRSGK